MRLLRPDPVIDGFFSRLHAGSSPVLLLDYDGTLAPFRAPRETATPYPGVPELLERLMDTGTRVVLVSGRRAQEVPKLLGLRHPVEVWGSHGMERLYPDGEYWVAPVPLRTQSALHEITDRVAASGLPAALELKPGSLVLHWRGLGKRQARALKQLALEIWKEMEPGTSISLVLFDGGLEYRVNRPNKGDAVRAICQESRPDAVIAYLGDDFADEEAFRALRGRGLTALVRPDFRATEADLWLAPTRELEDFLNLWLITSGGDSCSPIH